jgi:peptide chain release factor
LESILLILSAGSGPEEYAHAAALTLQVLQNEIESRQNEKTTLQILETEPSRLKGNIRSALVAIEGAKVQPFADSWTGVIQWIWNSAYRPNHKRKNWFVSVKPFVEPAAGELFSPSDVRFEKARAGGPGGQYVNKTESAVRAVHIPTGKFAVAREERSQAVNKKIALARLSSMFQKEQAEREGKSRSTLRHSHWELERGNPIRVYDGETMKLLKLNLPPKGEKLNG